MRPLYKTKSIEAKDVKPGDILTGRIESNRWPNIMTVKEVSLTTELIYIKTTSGMTYMFDPQHEFQKEITPAEEAEMYDPESEENEIRICIDHLDTEISDCAFSILDRIEMHIKTLMELRNGKSPQEIDQGSFDTIGEDFKKAAETAIKLAEHAIDQEALREELMNLDVEHNEK